MSTVNPIQSFESSAIAFGQKIEEFVKAEAAKIESFAEYFLPKVAQDVEQAVEVAVEEIASLCGNAVLNEAPKVLSGTEKFGNAVASVFQQVEAGGKAIAIETVRGGVQMAYDDIKNAAAAIINAKPTT